MARLLHCELDIVVGGIECRGRLPALEREKERILFVELTVRNENHALRIASNRRTHHRIDDDASLWSGDDVSLFVNRTSGIDRIIIVVVTKKNLKTMKMMQPQRRVTNNQASTTSTSAVRLLLVICVAVALSINDNSSSCCHAFVSSSLPQLARRPMMTISSSSSTSS